MARDVTLGSVRRGLATIVLAVCVLAGCGDGMEKASAPAPSKQAKTVATPAKKAAGKRTFVKVRKTRYGRILTDGRGRALYLFTKEATERADCYGQCAHAWPPFYAKGKVAAGKGARQGGIGVTMRREKRPQVTYKGHPLYYYVTDKAPGQVTCQAVAEYGGTWLVVAPSGEAIS
jgi:predicted lipoprotein with Yx(FWY)xxD motif